MAQLAKKSYRRGKHTIKENWDSLLWIIGMFATLYLTEFMSNVLFNPLIHRYIIIPSDQPLLLIMYNHCVSLTPEAGRQLA